MIELTPRDLEDLKYDLRDASIFFPEPLRVYIPGFPEFEVGEGFGGLHWSLFERGADCNACGNCCNHTFRRLWFWWETEAARPLDLEELPIRINGSWHHLYVHVNSSYDRCDFLVTSDEIVTFEFRGQTLSQPKEFCSLHRPVNIKPAHCHLHPQTGVYDVGGIPMLSRRLPSRNWRWPKCPIPLAEVPYQTKDFLDDHHSLRLIASALERVPGSYSWPAFELWRDNALGILNRDEGYESRNILFRNAFLDA